MIVRSKIYMAKNHVNKFVKFGFSIDSVRRVAELNQGQLNILSPEAEITIPKDVPPHQYEAGIHALARFLASKGNQRVKARNENIKLDKNGELERFIKHAKRTGKLRQSDLKWLAVNGYTTKSKFPALYGRLNPMNHRKPF